MKRANRTKMRRSPAARIAYDMMIAAMLLICAAIIYPFVNMIAISLSDTSAVRSGSISLFPQVYKASGYRFGATFEAYEIVAKNSLVYRGYFNTIKVALISCVLSLLLTGFAAYPMAFSNMKFKKLYMQIIVVTMWFSAGTVPNYMVVKSLRLIDTHAALIFCSLLSGYNIIVMRGFFYGIPKSLAESAKIDGANDFQILFKIIFPVSYPILSTIALWVVVGQWNQYQNPLLYIESKDKYVLQQVLAGVVRSADNSDFDISEGTSLSIDQVRNAAMIFTMLPILALFPFFQKFLISGAVVGAVKE